MQFNKGQKSREVCRLSEPQNKTLNCRANMFYSILIPKVFQFQNKALFSLKEKSLHDTLQSYKSQKWYEFVSHIYN